MREAHHHTHRHPKRWICRRIVQYSLSAPPEEDARRRIRARRRRCARILGNLWGSRKGHNHHARRQRLLGQSEGNHKSTAASGRFTLALRPVPHGTRRFCFARRYFGCASSIRRGGDQRRDGSGFGCCLPEPRGGYQGSARRTSWQLVCRQYWSECANALRRSPLRAWNPVWLRYGPGNR